MILAIDTSTRKVGIALYDGVQVLSEMYWESRDHHTVELAPAVVEGLSRAKIQSNDLNAVVVAQGPGSFTGLRIGMAFAKGLALSQRIPLIGIPSLDIIAAVQPVRNKTRLAAVLRAGRKRLAVGWYKPKNGKWVPTGKLDNLLINELVQKIKRPTIVCGELTEEGRRRLGRKYRNVIIPSPAFCVRRPGVLAELGWLQWEKGEYDDPTGLAPIYLHQGEPIPG